ncbi:MAG: MotA/TolQ/ExbB proton channel family protein [Planctomycetes bacterium]|nr:MotA/TolQ/ExbB proton channel family protein [Planctomycetota bacterium]
MQEFLETTRTWCVEKWTEAVAIWSSGGWAMIAIAVIAMGMFGIGLHVHLRLRSKGFHSVPEKTWRRWIDHPWERTGPIGRLLDFVTGGTSLHQTSIFFEQLRTTETTPFERDLRVMKICVSAAPLVGLLGTVTGMLATFNALASGSGGDQTMAMIASGISEALITTETGLVIALPGLFFQYHLGRKFEGYKAFLAHLETVCTQTVHRESLEEKARTTHRQAQAEVARIVLERLRAMQAQGRSIAPVVGAARSPEGTARTNPIVAQIQALIGQANGDGRNARIENA